MTPRTVDMLEDGFPHGTTDGFALGCRSAGACPAGQEHGLSCRRAQILSAGNYQYQRLVRRGEEPEVIAQMLRLGPEEQTAPAKASTALKAPAPQVQPEAATEVRGQPLAEVVSPAAKRKWAVRHAWVAFDPDGRMHGPFDGQPAAIDFVGSTIRKSSTVTSSSRARKPWTDDDTKNLRELNALGFSDQEVARRIGRSQSLVSSYRRRLGLKSARQRTKGGRA